MSQPAEISQEKKQESPLFSLIINVLLPVIILQYLSNGDNSPLSRAPGEKFWHIGPIWAMVVALSIPIGYGVSLLLKGRKPDIMSLLGILGVIATGLLTIFVRKSDGSVHSSTPWLFGCKEGLIPLLLGIVTLVTHNRQASILRLALYTPDIFNVRRISAAVEANGSTRAYEKTLWRCSQLIAISFFISTIANFFLCRHFLDPVLSLPAEAQSLAYNQAVGKITGWGFLVIGGPCFIMIFLLFCWLKNQLVKLTNLDAEKIANL